MLKGSFLVVLTSVGLLGACGNGEGEAAVKLATDNADKICACKDTACSDEAMKAYTAQVAELRKTTERGTLEPEHLTAIKEAAERWMKCQVALAEDADDGDEGEGGEPAETDEAGEADEADAGAAADEADAGPAADEADAGAAADEADAGSATDEADAGSATDEADAGAAADEADAGSAPAGDASAVGEGAEADAGAAAGTTDEAAEGEDAKP